jgi:hypothetical protein
MRSNDAFALAPLFALESVHPEPQEFRVRANGRKGDSQARPDPTRQDDEKARQLSRETSRLIESLQYRLLRLRTIGEPDAKAIAMECERALGEIRKELDAVAAERRSKNEGS